jgi:hypothetical protein
VREERVALKHHAHAAVGRAECGHVVIADQDAPGRDRFEPGDQAKRRRLAAAGRAEQGDEAAGGDDEAHVAHGRHRPVPLRHVRKLDARGAPLAHAEGPAASGASAGA